MHHCIYTHIQHIHIQIQIYSTCCSVVVSSISSSTRFVAVSVLSSISSSTAPLTSPPLSPSPSSSLSSTTRRRFDFDLKMGDSEPVVVNPCSLIVESGLSAFFTISSSSELGLFLLGVEPLPPLIFPLEDEGLKNDLELWRIGRQQHSLIVEME